MAQRNNSGRELGSQPSEDPNSSDEQPFSILPELFSEIESVRQGREDDFEFIEFLKKIYPDYLESGVFPHPFTDFNEPAHKTSADDSGIIGPRGNNEHSAAQSDVVHLASVHAIPSQLDEQAGTLTPITREHAAIASTSDASKGKADISEVDVQRAVVVSQARDTTSTQDQTHLEPAQKRALEPTDDSKTKKPKA